MTSVASNFIQVFGPLLFSSAIAALLFILFLSKWAGLFGLLDHPDERKRHKGRVPLVGGLAIYFVLLTVTLWFLPSDRLGWLMISVTILVGVGAWDDAVGVGIRTRFIFQILASLIVIFFGSLWIRNLGIQFLGLDSLSAWVGVPITLFAVLGLVNAFNFVDGIDGLAGGHMLVGIASICFGLLMNHGSIHRVEWMLPLAATVCIFLLVNLSLTPFPKVFLGDAGSLMFGFILAWILIYFTQDLGHMPPVAALWCVSIPVFDTLNVILLRLKEGKLPFYPDRKHLHHQLIDSGFSERHSLIVIMVLSVLVNFGGLVIMQFISQSASLGLFAAFLIGFVVAMRYQSIKNCSPVEPK